MAMSAADATAIRTGVRAMLNRQEVARAHFVAQIADAIGSDKAEAAFASLNKVKALKWDGSRYTVKHGAFWETDVLLRAAAL